MKSLEERFWPKVQKIGKCWTWVGDRTKAGYGVFRFPLHRLYAHRASWILHFGVIPKGQYVLHRCDNPSCVNPKHLFLGTHVDNIRDMLKKGRHNFQVNPSLRGEGCCKPKLTKHQVLEIRELCRVRVMKIIEIAKKYSVDRSLVYLIQKRKVWKNVA